MRHAAVQEIGDGLAARGLLSTPGENRARTRWGMAQGVLCLLALPASIAVTIQEFTSSESVGGPDFPFFAKVFLPLVVGSVIGFVCAAASRYRITKAGRRAVFTYVAANRHRTDPAHLVAVGGRGPYPIPSCGVSCSPRPGSGRPLCPPLRTSSRVPPAPRSSRQRGAPVRRRAVAGAEARPGTAAGPAAVPARGPAAEAGPVAAEDRAAEAGPVAEAAGRAAAAAHDRCGTASWQGRAHGPVKRRRCGAQAARRTRSRTRCRWNGGRHTVPRCPPSDLPGWGGRNPLATRARPPGLRPTCAGRCRRGPPRGRASAPLRPAGDA